MTKLAKIQEAIRQLDHHQQDRLRIWLAGAPLDLEEESASLEAEILKGVQSPHASLVKEELEAVADKAMLEHRKRRTA